MRAPLDLSVHVYTFRQMRDHTAVSEGHFLHVSSGKQGVRSHKDLQRSVSTTSHEAVLSNTKVLEIPLLPENNMRAM